MGVGSRITYWTVTAGLVLIHLTWFAAEIGLSTINDFDLVSNNNDTPTTLSPSSDSVNYTTAEYVWRNIFLAAALVTTWFAERYPLSRAAALTAFTVTTILTFSWIPMNLYYAYSIFAQNTTSYRTEFCQAAVNNSICQLTFAVGVLSVIHIVGLFTVWLLSLYQIARSEVNPAPTLVERITRVLLYLGLAGVVVWSLATIPLNTDTNHPYFTMYNISANYQQGYQWALIAASFGSAAWISYGATKGAKWVALLSTATLFVNMLPPFIYDAKRAMSCPPINTPVDTINWHCNSSMAIAGGEGIVASVAALLMLALMVSYNVTDQYDMYTRTKLNNDVTRDNETSLTDQQPMQAV